MKRNGGIPCRIGFWLTGFSVNRVACFSVSWEREGMRKRKMPLGLSLLMRAARFLALLWGGIWMWGAVFQTVIPWRLFPRDPIPNRIRIQRITSPPVFSSRGAGQGYSSQAWQIPLRACYGTQVATWLKDVGHNDMHLAGEAYWSALKTALLQSQTSLR